MSIFFIYNNQFYREGTSVISPDNHGFKYGDGLFETIRAENEKLFLEQYHFERLFYGLNFLGFNLSDTFTQRFLTGEIKKLLRKNGHDKSARIRLVVFRGD